MGWTLITEDRYDEQLCALPPTLWLGKGFLFGEAWDHDVCTVTKVVKPRYAAFLRFKKTHWENERPMTVDEFIAFDPRDKRWQELFQISKPG